MHVSLSELEAAAVKAVMAVGLPLGLGEDAGRAAKLMLRSGLGSLADLVDALDAVDGGRSAGCAPEPALAGRFVPANGADRLSALRAGPPACDRLAATTGAAAGADAVTLAAVDCPALVLHEVIELSHTLDVTLSVAWSRADGGSGEIVCRQGGARPVSGGDIGGPADLTIGPAAPGADVPPVPPAPPDRGDGAEVDDAVWARLCAYADRRLVESTEESRLSGAGAGVIDTD